MKLDDAPVRANLLSEADRQLVDGVLAGQRRALAKAITLIESTRADHQQRAQQVLSALLPRPATPSASASPVCGAASPRSSRRSASG
jgi:hypothetical protein